MSWALRGFSALLDRDGSQDKLVERRPARTPTQMAYQSTSTRDLRILCDDRRLGHGENLKRSELITLLEDEDSRSRTWVETKRFEAFFLFIVLLNATFIGWQIDHPETLQVSHFAMLNVTFLLIFISEIILKVGALGWRRYIKDYWHVFDVVVTLLAAVEICSTYILLGDYFYKHMEQYVAADCVQILRLCRLFRLAKVFPALGRLIRAFLMSLKALLWIFVLLLLWFYLSGCFATVFVGRRELLPDEDHNEIRDLRSKFASIPLSMFALFEIMTLEGWVDYVRPLLHSRPHLVCFFLIFIFITAFFMLNLVTAVIVDRTRVAQDEELEYEAKEALLQRKVHINEICQALRQENRMAPVPDLMNYEDCETTVSFCDDVAEALQELGWSKRYLMSMFSCLDQNNDGQTSISSLQKFLEISDKPLDTANYMRFQLTLSHRLEHQEKLLLSVLGVLENMTQQKLEIPAADETARADPTLEPMW
mmetsp:Transcript_31337/g.89961  ORF Transcript_31337/g.89961 Transcript_31337/m.89961 type:complete len:480 (+) Transcript_31337:83-1522(+)